MNDAQRSVLERIDAAAQSVTLLHHGVQLALTGKLGLALDQQDPTAPMHATRFASQVTARTSMFMRDIERALDRDANELVRLGISDTGASLAFDRTQELMSLSSSATLSALASVNYGIAADIQTAQRQFRLFQFEASMLMTAGRSRSSSLLIARQGKVSGLKFERADRLNRLYSSTTQTANAARQLFLTAYVEAYVFTLAANGVDIAYVDYADPEHVNHGLAFSISGSDASLPAYLDIRDTVWHPNAQALVSNVSP